MNSQLSGLTLEQEQAAWHKHHVESLLEWAQLPFTKKLELVEEMVEVARSMHGGKLPRSPDEHEERTTL